MGKWRNNQIKGFKHTIWCNEMARKIDRHKTCKCRCHGGITP